jgi:hypothetical protein
MCGEPTVNMRPEPHRKRRPVRERSILNAAPQVQVTEVIVLPRDAGNTDVELWRIRITQPYRGSQPGAHHVCRSASRVNLTRFDRHLINEPRIDGPEPPPIRGESGGYSERDCWTTY